MTLSLKTMTLRNLSELRQICNGPKYIVSLNNLGELNIIECKKLRAIFCDSIVKSLPQLKYLEIEDCDELVEIIEESDADHLHPLCFPKLERLYITRCKSLKCTFSISTTLNNFSTVLPDLPCVSTITSQHQMVACSAFKLTSIYPPITHFETAAPCQLWSGLPSHTLSPRIIPSLRNLCTLRSTCVECLPPHDGI